jgi:hypothetical protein
MNVAWKQGDFHKIVDQSSIIEPNFDSINDALHVICEPGDVHEVRVPSTNLGVLAGWFDDLEAMSNAILDLTRGEGKYEGKYGFKDLRSLPESVYVSLNPVSDDLLALVGNQIKSCDTTTRDHEIVGIKRLFLDGDPWRRKGVSSTAEGHSLAITKMIEVRNYLIEMGFPHPCLADSGNGAHLIHATLLENTPDDRALVEAYVKVVSLRFGMPCKHGDKAKPPSPGYDDTIINIDTAVFNPARIVTAYGTMKRKGTDIPKRPHRLSRILESPGRLEIVERGMIEKVVADLTPKSSTTVNMASSEHGPDGESTLSDEDLGFGSIDIEELGAQRLDEPFKPIEGFDLAAQLEEMGVLAGEPEVAGVFTYFPLSECPFNSEHKKVVLSQHRSGTITYLCPHHSCQGKKEGFRRKTARDYFDHYGVTIPVTPQQTTIEKPKQAKTSRVSLAVQLARQHCTITKDAATNIVNTSFMDLKQRITCPVDSQTFRHWLVRIFRDQTGSIIKSSEVSDAVLNLMACYSAYVTTYRRITRIDDIIYIDTLNEGKIVKITSDGWQIQDDCPDGLVFETRKDMGKLALPRSGGNLDDLWEFINVRQEDRETYLCFLLASLAGRKPYPILLGNGQEGSAKTTFMNFTVAMIDPCIRASGKDVPNTRRDLVIQARNRHLIAYDNVSRISGDMSDAYCRLSTGAGFTVRGLYKDDEEMVFGGANPVLFNGIPELGDKSDFLSRSIRVRLPKILPGQRKTERYLEERWDERGPTILGILYDLIANGLNHESSVEAEGNAPRMIDNYHWFRACEMGTGLRLADRFRENYDTLIREVAFETLTGKAVLAFMRDRRLTKLGEMPEEQDVWRGTMSELYEAIKPKWLEVCDGSTKQRNLLPGSSARLTNAIEAIASSLVANGIVFTRGRSNDQRWAQIDATGFFQGEVGDTVYLSNATGDVAQNDWLDQVTTPLPAGVTT